MTKEHAPVTSKAMDLWTSMRVIAQGHYPELAKGKTTAMENEIIQLLADALAEEAERVRREHAIEWELRPETSFSAGDEISLVRRDGFKGRRWAIKQRGYVLNKAGEWEHEPIPSSRTEEWLETVRWNTPEEAIRALAAKAKP